MAKTKEDETWESVEVPEKENKEEKVEYEVEGEEEKEEIKAEAPEVKTQEEKEEEPQEEEIKAEEVQEEKVEEEVPEELEGIKTKGAQKRIKQLIRQRKERDEQIQQLLNERETLTANLQSRDSESIKLNQLNLQASEKQLTDKMELARSAYLEAFESNNKEKLLQAQEALNEAQSDLKTIGANKYQLEQQAAMQAQVSPPTPMPPQLTPDPRAEEWALENSWFGPDRIMTASALAIDAELKAEGYNTQDDEFYQEIDRRIKETFPQKFTEDYVPETRQQGTTSRPAQVVAGASRSAPSPKKVKLSQSDLRLAEKWNIPIEQYAQEKIKADHAEGGYTNVNMKRGG